MALKSSISSMVPYFALLACVFSVLHPSRDIRMVRQLRKEFDALRVENAQLRSDIVGVVQFIRDTPFPAPSADSGAGAVPDGAAPAPEFVAEGRYMVSRGIPGFSVGEDWWCVGDSSPWGRIDSAFRGGFVADGRVYSFVGNSLRERGIND